MTALCSGKICTIFPEKGALNFWKACTIALEYSRTVLEFFAVGDLSTAVLLRAVKGGVNLPQTKISAIFKVHLCLFLFTQFS